MEKKPRAEENGSYFSLFYILAIALIILQMAYIIYVVTSIKGKSVASAASEKVKIVKSIHKNPIEAKTQPKTVAKVVNQDIVQTAIEKAKLVRQTMTSSEDLVIDFYNPGHTISNPDLCSGDVKTMICVMSKSSDAERRTAIRMTWGNYKVKYNTVSIGFFVGTTNDSEINLNLDIEDETYGDLIKNNILDSDYNLTLKTVSMFEWIQTYCPTIERIVKVEDDVFLNIPQLIEYLSLVSYETKMIFGRIETKPVEKKEFEKSMYGVYAPKLNQRYTAGPCYVITKDSIQDLFENSLLEPYTAKEDVFITGTLADKVNLTRIYSSKFYNANVGPRPCYALRGISIAFVKPDDQFNIWKKTFTEKAACESPIKYMTQEEKASMIDSFDTLFGNTKRLNVKLTNKNETIN